jgi:predicted PurR-regulated permease PerM
MLEGREGHFLKKTLYIAAILAVSWLAFKYLLPGLLPFLLAFLVACILEPLVSRMAAGLRIKRWFSALLSTLAFLSLLVSLIVFAAGRIIYEITSFIKQLPTFIAPFLSLFRGAEESMYGYIIAAPPEIQSFFQNTLDSLREQSSQLPGICTTSCWGF